MLWIGVVESELILQRTLWVFIGGGVGAALRFIVAMLVTMSFGSGFPLGILVVNIVGSFVMGYISYYVTTLGVSQSYLVYLLMTGVLGGFTTFSSFSIDTITLFMANRFVAATANILLSLVLSLLAAYVGILCSKMCFS